ncbi:MAG: methyltransferase domain-containing protein [Planctomycetes bacterium]|nr:methyltransferase domain-containing protein [Planctomycetota bacterium]
MKERLLNWLVCPACRGYLKLDAWRRDGEEIRDGLLGCWCGEHFPIIEYLPRMLLGDLRDQLYQDYPNYFRANRSRLPDGQLQPARALRTTEAKTQRSFGFEWTQFSQIRAEWEKNFWGYMAPKTSDFFSGKLVLDAGCGMGRHLYHCARHSEEAIGVDFSRSVDAAFQNTQHLPNVHLVQGDLQQLPFGDRTFDFVYCLGVLHHVPEADRALRQLLNRLRPGGEMRVYLYWDLSDGPRWKRNVLRTVTVSRTITTRLPHRVLGILCYPIAAGAWLTFVAPYKALSRVAATKQLAAVLPLKQYADYPFAVLVNDQFDRFSAPLERRCSRVDVQAWLESAGLEEVTVAPHHGWLGHGTVPDEILLSEREADESLSEVERGSPAAGGN